MKNKSIVILTGSEKRHQFARIALSKISGIKVLASICEDESQSVRRLVLCRANEGVETELNFIEERQFAEDDVFSHFCALVADDSNPQTVSKGDVNDPEIVSYITNHLKPELVVAFGCSILREPLLSSFRGRLLNLHLGLSPYYRGAASNFWPLVNGEPEYVGATFMHLDSGIDTGEIIHQIRARVYRNDTPHQIGNRLIVDAVFAYGAIIRRIDELHSMPQPTLLDCKYYRTNDYDRQSVEQVLAGFREGMIDIYLRNKSAKDAKVPIVINRLVDEESIKLNSSQKSI